jgi:hypothetical protein
MQKFKRVPTHRFPRGCNPGLRGLKIKIFATNDRPEVIFESPTSRLSQYNRPRLLALEIGSPPPPTAVVGRNAVVPSAINCTLITNAFAKNSRLGGSLSVDHAIYSTCHGNPG